MQAFAPFLSPELTVSSLDARGLIGRARVRRLSLHSCQMTAEFESLWKVETGCKTSAIIIVISLLISIPLLLHSISLQRRDCLVTKLANEESLFGGKSFEFFVILISILRCDNKSCIRLIFSRLVFDPVEISLHFESHAEIELV